MKRIFAADIGGTNSRFAYFEVNNQDEFSLLESRWLKTGAFSSFAGLINKLYETGFKLQPGEEDIAVISVAGPVVNEIKSSPPFISWDIDVSKAKKPGFKNIILINDFVAQAYACLSPYSSSAKQILSGKADKNGSIAVIGAGTALGKAVLVPDGRGEYIAMPSEGGHADFPFETERECEFQRFLLKELGEYYITANYVVSGRGISNIHWFLTGERLEPSEITSDFSKKSETLTWASRFYGRACRNFALEVLATGGLYISGGVAAKVPELVTHKVFEEEFRRSKTMSDILANIPVFLMTDEDNGLWGAAFFGSLRLKK